MDSLVVDTDLPIATIQKTLAMTSATSSNGGKFDHQELQGQKPGIESEMHTLILGKGLQREKIYWTTLHVY